MMRTLYNRVRLALALWLIGDKTSVIANVDCAPLHLRMKGKRYGQFRNVTIRPIEDAERDVYKWIDPWSPDAAFTVTGLQ